MRSIDRISIARSRRGADSQPRGSTGRAGGGTTLDQASSPIRMAADRFQDGAVFDPDQLPRYLESLEISSLRIRIDELPESLA